MLVQIKKKLWDGFATWSDSLAKMEREAATVRSLCFALGVAWFAASSAAAAEPKSQYGDFSPDADGLQAYRDYLRGLEMIEVEAGPELQQAIEAIPVELSVPITPEQEADLRDWLYDFLVAFSVSGSDSLAAEFYLREGVNSPEAIQQMKKDLENGPSFKDKAMLKVLKATGVSIPPLPKPVPDAGDTPLAILKTQHRQNLDMKGRDYFFSNISFFDSSYNVFELQGEYESYAAYGETHGLLPVGFVNWSPRLVKKEIKQKLKAGGQGVFAQFLFIAEEPEESADFEKGAIRCPFFVRLVWSPEKNMWRLVEIFSSPDAPVVFVFAVL